MQKQTTRAVIMAGAEIKDYSFYKPQAGEYVICADRGYRHALRLGITPDCILGDFDSLNMPFPRDIPILTFPAEKDETDLQIAIDYAVSKGFSDLYIIGAFGGRVDHFLGNIALFEWGRKKGAKLVMEDGDTTIRLLTKADGELQIPRDESRYLSIIPYFGDARITAKGTKYPVEETLFSVGDTLGISNEIKADFARISIQEGKALILLCRKDHML